MAIRGAMLGCDMKRYRRHRRRVLSSPLVRTGLMAFSMAIAALAFVLGQSPSSTGGDGMPRRALLDDSNEGGIYPDDLFDKDERSVRHITGPHGGLGALSAWVKRVERVSLAWFLFSRSWGGFGYRKLPRA